jgi:hypothetical protein
VVFQNLAAAAGLPEPDGFVGRSGHHDAGLGQDDPGPDAERVSLQVKDLAVVNPDLEERSFEL